MPPAGVIVVKVVPPVEVEALGAPVVGVDLNIVVSGVPWHASVVEACAPGGEGWGPEVHHEDLVLVHEVDVWGSVERSDLSAIESPDDVLWGPLDLILMPVSSWVEAVDVLLVLLLVMLEGVGAEGAWLSWDNLDIDLVPLVGTPIWAVPEEEEGSDGSLLSTSLDSGLEETILEILVGSDLTTTVSSSLGAGKHQGSKCKFLKHLFSYLLITIDCGRIYSRIWAS